MNSPAAVPKKNTDEDSGGRLGEVTAEMRRRGVFLARDLPQPPPDLRPHPLDKPGPNSRGRYLSPPARRDLALKKLKVKCGKCGIVGSIRQIFTRYRTGPWADVRLCKPCRYSLRRWRSEEKKNRRNKSEGNRGAR